MIASRHGRPARVVCAPQTGAGCPGRDRRILRHGTAVALALVASFLGGCVYLRLLELKHQLAAFDRNFSVSADDGVRITCQSPVLLADDVRWIGIYPETVKRLGRAEQWRIRWVKVRPCGAAPEAQAFDIVVDLTFADGQLARVAIPERYFAVMPKKFLVGVIKSLGAGHLDRNARRVEADVSEAEMAAARPSLPAIDKLLGRASDEHVEGTTTVVHYRYAPVTRESRAGTFDMTLYFDTASGALLHWRGRTPVGNIGFNFSAQSAKS